VNGMEIIKSLRDEKLNLLLFFAERVVIHQLCIFHLLNLLSKVNELHGKGEKESRGESTSQ